MSKLKKLAKVAGGAALIAGAAYGIKKGRDADKIRKAKESEKESRDIDHQALKNLEKNGSSKAKASAKKYRKDKGIGPRGGKVKFIRKNGRLIPIRG